MDRQNYRALIKKRLNSINKYALALGITTFESSQNQLHIWTPDRVTYYQVYYSSGKEIVTGTAKSVFDALTVLSDGLYQTHKVLMTNYPENFKAIDWD